MERRVDPLKTYFISDLHFFDKSILRIADRPFEDIDEMKRHIVNKWNDTVKNRNDLVIINGDLTMSDENLSDIIKSLRGRKWLIKGNHDEKSNKYYMDMGFEFVSSFPIVVNDYFIISHEPLFMNNRTPFINIFGHVHNNPIYKKVSSNSYCTSVEMNDYKPILLMRIIEEVKREGAF